MMSLRKMCQTNLDNINISKKPESCPKSDGLNYKIYLNLKLLLKVNRKKSKIGRPIEIKYLDSHFTINSTPRSI